MSQRHRRVILGRLSLAAASFSAPLSHAMRVCERWRAVARATRAQVAGNTRQAARADCSAGTAAMWSAVLLVVGVIVVWLIVSALMRRANKR